MWSRKDIKEYAKDFLRKHYWKAFLACLIVTLLSGEFGDSINDGIDDIINEQDYNEEQMIDEDNDNIFFENENKVFKFITRGIKSPLYLISGGVFSTIIIIILILSITIGYALEVGLSRFFLQGFKEDVGIGKLFSTFNSEEYLPIVKTQFLRSLYGILWTLLFIIPGIIKAYEYRFVPYILSEKPDLSSNEIITLSREITKGHKKDMFIFDISFIGWYLLGSLLLGVGVLFVDPYREASYARLYNVLSGNDDLENDVIDDYDVIIE